MRMGESSFKWLCLCSLVMYQPWFRLGPLVTFVMNRSCMLTLLRIGNNRLGVDWRYWVWITLRVYGAVLDSH